MTFDTTNEAQEPVWLGYFVVYVLNYRVDHDSAWQHNRASAIEGSPAFTWGDGWAIGNNTRGRYCSRSAHDKIKRFTKYNEARLAIQQRKRKYPKQDFCIVYIIDRSHHYVRTLEESIDIDRAHLEASEIRKKQIEQVTPELNVLLLHYKIGKAMTLSGMLARVRKDGVKQTLESGEYSRSTFYANLRALQEAGIDIPAS